MSRNSRNQRRSHSEFDDFSDNSEDSFAPDQGQDKMKQLGFDLIGRWHWIALGLILGLLGSMYYLSKAPKNYLAISTVLLKQQTGTVMGTRDRSDEMNLGTIEAMNTIAERLARQELLQKVASRPDIRELPMLIPEKTQWLPGWMASWFGESKQIASSERTPPPSPALLAGHISSWLSISVRKGTRLLDISVTHQSPEVAKAVADALAIEYQAELAGARNEGRSSSVEILIKESEQARTRLQTAQNAIANYMRALATLKDLEIREAAVNELKRRYLPKHPKLAAALVEQSTYESQFLNESEAARNSPADRSFWESHEEEWQSAGGDANAKLQVARRLLVARSSVLDSEIKSQTQIFNTILSGIQEAQINSQGSQSEMEVSSLAIMPTNPSSPNPLHTIVAGLFGGTLLGVLLAYIFIRLDNKLHTVAEVERETNLPVLAAIADIQPGVLAQIIKEKKVDVSTISSERTNWDAHLVFREGITSSTFAEMFRVLRASISLLGDEKKRKITLFSSSLPGEGKSLVSCNFALAAALQGKKTLLIDMDLRKPAIHKYFGLQRDSHPCGMTELLSNQAEFPESIFTATGENNLHLILSGKHKAPNPGELLNPTSIEEILQKAKEIYDVIVIDSAPLLAVPDTRVLAPLVNNFCLVARAEYVHKGALRRTLSLVEHDGNIPAGIVFNGFTEKRRLMGLNYSYGNYQTNRYGRAYRYGYGSYGSYGSQD